MVKIVTTRKMRFRAALILAGMTQADWAKMHDLSRGYVNMVLNGKMNSLTLNSKLDDFIEAIESQVAA